MIPKIIHYCWFGNNPLDAKAIHCINSWKTYFPDYEIIQWNEHNFDIEYCDFIRKAYADQRWAFVSDVARLQILYDHGGIYFDTDVEVIAPFDDILASDSCGFLGTEKTMLVASGLGFGAEKGAPLLKNLLDIYDTIDYNCHRDNLSEIACTVLTTEYLKQQDFQPTNQLQRICDFDIYPAEYFAPLDYYTGLLQKTSRTHSIHWYSASWLSEQEKAALRKSQKLSAIIGKSAADHVMGISSCIKREGILPYLRSRFRKYLHIR